MNCTNCGAPMQLRLEQQQFFCPYCSSIFFPEKNEDHVRILAEESDIECPVCRVALVYAFIEQTQILYCQSCTGMLIDQGSFLALIEYLRTNLTLPPIAPPAVDFSELERPLHCPTCGDKMLTHLYGGPGNLVVDNCSRCLKLWLDHQEFNRIIRAPGRERPLDDNDDDESGEG